MQQSKLEKTAWTEAGWGGKEGPTWEDRLIKYKEEGRETQVAGLKMGNYIHLDCEDKLNSAPCTYMCHLHRTTYIFTAKYIYLAHGYTYINCWMLPDANLHCV